MYNQDRKELYLEQKPDLDVRKTFYTRLFTQSERFEEAAGKDLCEFTTPEIENMFKTISYRSSLTFIGDLYQYGVYCDWCMKNGFIQDGQNHFREIKTSDAQKYMNVQKEEISVVSRNQLLQWCQQSPNPSDAAILLGVFEGVDGKEHMELFELRVQDLHKENDSYYVDTCYRKHVPISPELYRFFLDSYREDWYYSCGSSMELRARLEESDHVIRQKVTGKPADQPYFKARRIWTRGARVLKQITGDAVSLRSVHNSGIIWYTNKQAAAHGMKGEQYVRSKYFDEVRKQYQNGFESAKRFLLRYGKFLK